MRQTREWYLLIKDFNLKRCAIVGPFSTSDHWADSGWYSKIDEARKVGREVMSESIRPDQLSEVDSYARQHDLTRVDINEILESPLDRSKEYYGKLPKYASQTDRNKVVRILCRDCRKLVWALLNIPYPGESELKKAEMGVYTATCLKCGYKASDNYNWFR